MAGKDYLKKIKAALLAGSMAVSLSACGDESEETKEVETTKVVEDVTTNTTKENICSVMRLKATICRRRS